MNTIEKKNRYNALLLIYGKCLSKIAKSDLEDCYSNDLSLSEIADQRNVSRNAVFMSIHNGEKELDKLEDQIGSMKHFKNLIDEIDALEKEEDIKVIKHKLKKIRKDLYYGI